MYLIQFSLQSPMANFINSFNTFSFPASRIFHYQLKNISFSRKIVHHFFYLFDHNHLFYIITRIVLYWSEVTLLQVPVASWFDDMTDSELLDLIPFFEKLSKVDNVYTLLCNSNHPYNISTTSSMINQSPPPQQQHNNLQVNNHATLNAGS